MVQKSAIDRVLARRSANELVNRLRTSLEEQEEKNGQKPLCSGGEQGIPGQLGLLPIDESLSETKSPCSHENEQKLEGYARFLCELSLGYEEHLGVKVDRHLEERFCRAYHSGNANVLLQAWMVMQGEMARRAKTLDNPTNRTYLSRGERR